MNDSSSLHWAWAECGGYNANMNRITTILEADADGTLHLPVPAELRHGKVRVTAVIERVNEQKNPDIVASAEAVERRKKALKELRELGGLSDVIPDPAAWQQEQRLDRPLPDRT